MKLKTIQVIWNGDPMNKVYPHPRWFEVLKYKIAINTRRILIISMCVGALIGSYKIGDMNTSTVFVNAEDRSQDIFSAKVEKLKDEVIEEIAKCESKNASQDLALVTYDNNSRGTLTGKHIASIGVMQFKVGTVQDFYKILHKSTLTNYEATMLALDNKKAKDFAKESIFKIQGALWHWSCATEEMGVRVTMIKSLEN